MSEYETGETPRDDDIGADELEFNPQLEPKSAKAWINLLKESQDAFSDWNDHCDNIDQLYGSLLRLSTLTRDKEYQIFWANMEVIKPSIYANPPVPVVTPKFKDRRPVPTEASEVSERACQVAFDLAEVDELMKLVRDDVALVSRGVAWCRYESARDAGKSYGSYYTSERVCIDFKNRRDFLHSLSRNWREVTWVAAASYMTRLEARERFFKYSALEYQNAEYKVDRDAKEIGGADARERGCFWEIWDKANQRVVWVAEGCENILDEDDPHLDLRQYFPCPKPAYSTVQRGSLVPVPEVMQYKDQLEEINMLTGRIHALSEAVVVKGFYPAGGTEIAEAVQTAINLNSSSQVLVPISNWAAFGGSKDVIIWMPMQEIAETIAGLVALRKQVIDDIYQITGLADIMRGDTDPQETLGAQTLKSQYGTTRIRDKQEELARFARDLVEITVEIIAEKFQDETIIEMSQTQLPTNAMVEQHARQIVQQLQAQKLQLQQVSQDPQSQMAMQQAQQQNPDQVQQAMAQGQLQIQQLMDSLELLRHQPTIEQVLKFLKDNRTRAFVLDIETDSTILVDENQEKQRRAEFVGVLSQLLPQLAQMIGIEPATAPFCGEVLKFATAPYRAGRSLDSAIDELVEQMKKKADQPKGDDPATANGKIQLQIEQIKQQTAREGNQSKEKIEQMKLEQGDRHQNQNIALKLHEGGQGENPAHDQVALQIQQEKVQQNREEHNAVMQEKNQDMQIEQAKADREIMAHQLDMRDRQQQAQFAQQAHQQRMMQPQRPPAPRGTLQ